MTVVITLYVFITTNCYSVLRTCDKCYYIMCVRKLNPEIVLLSKRRGDVVCSVIRVCHSVLKNSTNYIWPVDYIICVTACTLLGVNGFKRANCVLGGGGQWAMPLHSGNSFLFLQYVSVVPLNGSMLN